ncbi:hypothetical protein [Halobaculum sp. EA56]|uniref:hypothetical protein n=1 Tax=Halobaculum sp. EA56 TaxID=3421648 RepID=UPI003EBB344E
MSEDVDDLAERLDGVQSVAQTALQQVADLRDELAEKEKTIERLEYRIAELEGRVDPDPHAKDYDDLERPEKVRMVRQELVRRAEATNGKAALDYSDVQWSVFDGHASARHCYDLMELAAQEDGFVEDDSGTRRITVDVSEVNDSSLFVGGNNRAEEVDV